MKAQLTVIVIHSFVNGYLTLNNSYTCGIDKSSATVVYEGRADIETYPWLGVLVYPIKNRPVTTTVVLITRQLVLGAALDIDRYPKVDFRARAKIVIGHNCSGPKIGIKDYTYHPDYAKSTYSALTIIQLDSRYVRIVTELRPICPPPAFFKNEQVFAMTLSHVCSTSMVRIYKMNYVNPDECKQYYRKFDVDVESMWPTHYACAKAKHGGDCIWQSGTALVIKQKNKWKLIGFGITGPGCEAPARFLDYGMNRQWVQNSVARMGRPAITRIAPDRVVLRRSLSRVQRYGECDPEELRTEMFSDTTTIDYKDTGYPQHIRYNISLLANIDYNCIVLSVRNNTKTINQANIHLHRWCTNPQPRCYDWALLEIHFSIHITYYGSITYKLNAYGQEIKQIDGKKVMAYGNRRKNYPHVYGTNNMSYPYAWKKFINGPIKKDNMTTALS